MAACVAAGGLLAAACAGAPPSPTVRLTGAQIALVTSSGGTAAAGAEVNSAFELLVQRCMRAKGLVYYPLILTAAQELNGIGLAGVPQAPIGLAAREADGYGFYSGAVRAAANPGQADVSPEEKYAKSAPPSYVLALLGPENQRISWTLPGGDSGTSLTGGCRGAAQRRVYGSIANRVVATTGLDDLTAQLQAAFSADPASTAVIARWSGCMARRGYKYATPEDLWNRLSGRIDTAPTPALRNLEIKTSVADYNCAAAVRLLPTIRALEDSHARYMSKALAGELARITQILARALKVAKAMRVAG